MMVERLEEYRSRMKELPKSIIVFRRGGSDGQIKQILNYEVSEIRVAFDAFKSYNPKLTFIVCTKGDQMRFNPAEDEKRTVPTQLLTGAVVNRTDNQLDFHLHVHTAAIPTRRATRYRVLIDESRFKAEILQGGINDLCYLCPLEAKSISMVPPAHLASRACHRAVLQQILL